MASFGEWIPAKVEATYGIKTDESAAVPDTGIHAFVLCLDCEVAHQLSAVVGLWLLSSKSGAIIA